jgi:hypothetical protein
MVNLAFQSPAFKKIESDIGHGSSGYCVKDNLRSRPVSRSVSPEGCFGSVIFEILQAAGDELESIWKSEPKATVTGRSDQRDVIAVPLRPAFLEGTMVANGFKPGDLAPVGDLIRLIGQMNDQAVIL